MDYQRSLAIDYIKCIGIILVVYGHYDRYTINVLHPYFFHMPLFFFLGGMLINLNKSSFKFYKDIFLNMSYTSSLHTSF